MKTLKIALLALMVCASVVTYAKPKKGVKTQNAQSTTVARINCTVENDGTVKEADGTVIGKVNAEGKIINAVGESSYVCLAKLGSRRGIEQRGGLQGREHRTDGFTKADTQVG